MNSVYHYCSCSTFKAILQNRTLRLSDIQKSNDPEEIYFLKSGFEEWFSLHRLKLENQKDYLRFKSEGLEKTFLVLCFSKRQDDLHMWSLYGNNGLALEFDKDELQAHLRGDASSATSPDPFIKCDDVEYFTSRSLQAYIGRQKLKKPDDFYKKLYKRSPFVKNAFFKGEEEWRAVYEFVHDAQMKFDDNASAFENYYKDDKLNQRIRFGSFSGNGFDHRLFLDVPFDPSLIKSITIGPNCSFTKRDLLELFFVCGLPEVKIKESEGCLR